ncbi:hypothetical protein NMS_0109 [Nonlabens marinus S1-08]|uniref:Uncharacterized protein n=1 Tax=Nonlabens marinus S1-08 TaxID=1454201 RepID=W8VTY6_9FLAO|nr:hypothetical protein NMS_0109 [Nonlabens marinus S1-08]
MIGKNSINSRKKLPKYRFNMYLSSMLSTYSLLSICLTI